MIAKVSAIIPVYNGERWIRDAIASIQAQTAAVGEIIVVDDHSGDESARIAESTGANVIRLAKNSGEARARNIGINSAKYDYIAMLDADDYWAPNHIEVLLSLLTRYPEAAVACAATQRVGEKSGIVTGYVPEGGPHYVFNQAFDDWLHTTIGCIFKRDALLAIGGFCEDQKMSCDYDLWLRLSRKYLFACSREITSYWRWHSNQMSQSYPAQLKAVYYYRHRLWKTLHDEGNRPEARLLAHRCIERWSKDCATLPGASELDYCRSLLDCAIYMRPSSIADLLLFGKTMIKQMLRYTTIAAKRVLSFSNNQAAGGA